MIKQVDWLAENTDTELMQQLGGKKEDSLLKLSEISGCFNDEEAMSSGCVKKRERQRAVTFVLKPHKKPSTSILARRGPEFQTS